MWGWGVVVQIVGAFVLLFFGNRVLLRNNQLIKLKGFLFERYRWKVA